MNKSTNSLLSPVLSKVEDNAPTLAKAEGYITGGWVEIRGNDDVVDAHINGVPAPFETVHTLYKSRRGWYLHDHGTPEGTYFTFTSEVPPYLEADDVDNQTFCRECECPIPVGYQFCGSFCQEDYYAS